MNAEERGRFCGSCQKVVVDFTTMSDQEVLSYFKNSGGKTCGRFRNDQLDRDFQSRSNKRLNWYKYFLQILIPALLFTSRSYSQGMVKTKAAVCNSPKTNAKEKFVMMGFIAPPVQNFIIKGKIIDNSGVGIAGATLIIKGTKRGSFTDANGIFSIEVDKFPITVVASSVGFEPFQTSIAEKAASTPVTIVLNYNVMGDVTVIGHSSGRKKKDLKIKSTVPLPAEISASQPGYETKKEIVDNIKPVPPTKALQKDEPLSRSLIGIRLGGVSIVRKTYAFQDFKKFAVDTARKMSSMIIPTRSNITTLNMYPNPMRLSSMLTFDFPVKTDGLYTIEIFDISGRSIQEEKFEAYSGLLRKQIYLKEGIGAGSFVVRLLGPEGKPIASEKLLVVE